MEEFVQSSGEHGIVVFSLGSMVNNLTDEKSNIIARALSQLPQKVNFLFSLNQLALVFFFVTLAAFSEPLMFRPTSFFICISAGCAIAGKLGSAERQSFLTGSSGVSLPLNQMTWRRVHRPEYKNHFM